MMNKEQLEAMSDFEINKLVAEIAIDKDVDIQTIGTKGLELYVVNTSGLLPTMDSLDYCNNPSDMWPLIIEKEISINFRARKNLLPVAKMINSDSNDVIHSNPLRAAAIVYLLMQEGHLIWHSNIRGKRFSWILLG